VGGPQLPGAQWIADGQVPAGESKATSAEISAKLCLINSRDKRVSFILLKVPELWPYMLPHTLFEIKSWVKQPFSF